MTCGTLSSYYLGWFRFVSSLIQWKTSLAIPHQLKRSMLVLQKAWASRLWERGVSICKLSHWPARYKLTSTSLFDTSLYFTQLTCQVKQLRKINMAKTVVHGNRCNSSLVARDSKLILAGAQRFAVFFFRLKMSDWPWTDMSKSKPGSSKVLKLGDADVT